MIGRVARAGFDTVFLQVRGRGEAFYQSRLEPRAADLASQPDDFDPLALALALGREAGLSVHAWVNVNLVASAASLPRSPDHVVSRHPEWLMVPEPLAAELSDVDPAESRYLDAIARWSRRESESVEGLYLSPILEAAQAYTVGVVREIVERYPVDGVHFDYVRYPGPAFDYSPAALAEFRASRLPFASAAERDGLDEAARRQPAAWARRLPESFEAFRRERLDALVARLAVAAREVRPDVLVSAAVVPDADEAAARKLQDWAGWARDGRLDAVCPMAYTPDTAAFAAQVAAVRDLLPDVAIWTGVGAYRLTAAQTAARVRLARQSGADGVVVFSYDSVAAERDGGARFFQSLRPALLEDSRPKPAR
jgi:uncharacterized lipoprotein YddW (UPF0748 family)